jgi:hypothetical protein
VYACAGSVVARLNGRAAAPQIPHWISATDNGVCAVRVLDCRANASGSNVGFH